MNNATNNADAARLHGQRFAPELLAVPAGWVEWDGAAPTTTHMIRMERGSYIMGHDVFAYVEVKVTGRGPRWQRIDDGTGSYALDGTKCLYRFTDDGSTAEWHDGVIAP